MVNLIPSLVVKQDNFEIIGLKIAEILLAETINQQALAVAATLDPTSWALRIFHERSNVWSVFQDQPVDQTTLVNVWFDSMADDQSMSNTIDRQKYDGIFNLDCYAYGVSEETIGGHEPGDKLAALKVQHACKLIRNWLMSPYHKYLEMQGIVWTRSIPSITIFQPPGDNAFVQNIIAGRLAVAVTFNETVEASETTVLNYLSASVYRDDESNEVLVRADYDYTE